MNVTDFPAMGLVGLDVGAPVRVPESERPILAAAKAVVAVGVESRRQNAALVATEHGRLLRRQFRRAAGHVAGESATYHQKPERNPLRQKSMNFIGLKNPTGFGSVTNRTGTEPKPNLDFSQNMHYFLSEITYLSFFLFFFLNKKEKNWSLKMGTSFAILIPDFILLWSVLVPKISEYTIWQTVLAKHIIMILLESC